jgi:glycosyltransferase involved in cell wall biosynthesis
LGISEQKKPDWKKIRARQDSDPIISVLVPCRNHGEFLLEAVASVERHAPEGTELLIIDDGSTQLRTLDVLKTLDRLGCRILQGGGRGLSAARNLAIRHSRAKYLLPLDADNRLLPGFLQKAVEILDTRPDVGVVHGDWIEFGGRNERRPTHDAVLSQLLLGNYIDACAVIRREAIDRVGGYCEEVSAWEDWDLWLSLCEHGIPFVRLLPGTLEATFEYRVRPNSMLAEAQKEETLIHLTRQLVHRHAGSYTTHRDALVYRAAHFVRDLPFSIRTILHESAAIVWSP